MKTNKEIIEAAESYANEFNDNFFAREVAFIAACKWIQEQDNWISVDDYMPKIPINVLVSDIESDIVTTGFYHKDTGWVVDTIGVNVTHWQPLPKSPKS